MPEGSAYKQGDLMTLKVTVIKPAAIKQDSCCLARLHWMVLTNSLTREAHFYEFRQTKDEVSQEFKSQIRLSGPQSYKAYCVNGRGEIWASNLINISASTN